MGLLSALVQGANQYGLQAAQFGYNKQLAQQQQDFTQQNMATSHQYEQENSALAAMLQQQNWQAQFDATNARQDYLLMNADRMSLASKRAAGINPAFANGAQAANVTSPSVAAPSVGTSAQGNVGLPSVGMPQSADLVGAYYADKQADNLDSDSDLKDAQAFSILKKTDPEVAELFSRKLLNDANAQESEARTESIRTLTPVQAQKYISESNLLDEQQRATAAKWPAELQVLYSQNAMIQQDTATSKSQENLNRARIGTEHATQHNLYAQSAYYYKQCEQVNKNIQYLGHLIGVADAHKSLYRNEAFKALQEGRIAEYVKNKQGTIDPETQRYLDMAESAWKGLVDGANVAVDLKTGKMAADSRVEAAEIYGDAHKDAARTAAQVKREMHDPDYARMQKKYRKKRGM